MTTDSHNAQILSYLKAGNSITALEALGRFGCLRLAARVWDLRRDGHSVERRLIMDERTGKRFAEYFIAEKVNA